MGMFRLVLRLLKSLLSLEGLLYATTVVLVGTSDPISPFSKFRDQRSRKRCQDKLHSTLDLWHNIRLPSIRLHGIRLPNIRPHSIRFLGINNNLFLPIKMTYLRKKIKALHEYVTEA